MTTLSGFTHFYSAEEILLLIDRTLLYVVQFFLRQKKQKLHCFNDIDNFYGRKRKNTLFFTALRAKGFVLLKVNITLN